MPAQRVTSQTPWHVVLVIDDSGSMAQSPSGPPCDVVNEGLRALFGELAMLSMGGAKPYFKASIIRFGDRARVIEECGSPADIDARIDSIATFDASSGTTNLAEAFEEAGRVLSRNPGQSSDYQPWVFVFSDGAPNSASDAVNAAQKLKSLNVAAGQPHILAFGFGDADDAFMKSIAASSEAYRRVDPQKIKDILPAIGTVAASATSSAQLQQGIQSI